MSLPTLSAPSCSLGISLVIRGESRHCLISLPPGFRRGDLRRALASEMDWKLKATGRAEMIVKLEEEATRQTSKLVSMEEGRMRLEAQKREVEAEASQVNPLKERVAALLSTLKEKDELIQRLKGAEVVAAQKLKVEQEATISWKVKVSGKQDIIDEQDRQVVVLQQALIDKYEDIREQVFSAEQVRRWLSS